MAASKRCPRCPALIPFTARYCPAHAAEYETKRGNSTQRGYDHKHQAKRRQYTARMARGETFTCHRCLLPVDPRQPWDLGHTDDRTAWTGPEHADGCNRAAGGRAAHV